MSVKQEKKPQTVPFLQQPLTQDEFNELQRLNLINARTAYDMKNTRFQLNLRREFKDG